MSVETGLCSRHHRETALRCGKCDQYICPQCVVPTPVGSRCRECAQLRRAPQFQVDPILLVKAGVAGLVTSLVVWYLIRLVPYLGYFLSIVVGAAVGEVMSRLARRRASRWLEAVAVADIVIGLLVVVAIEDNGTTSLLSAARGTGSGLFGLVIPMAIASVIAVLRLRR
ncbi:MAG: B-box zinc finger protein [Chloroflexota bacterium]